MSIERMTLALFVPGDRPERFPKAFRSGADAVILDLEDAVAPANKLRARAAIAAYDGLEDAGCTVLIRVNPAGSPWHEADVTMAGGKAVAGLVLPKVEHVGMLAALAPLLGRPVPILAMIESARGLVSARDIGRRCARLAFGSFDYAADLACAHDREALRGARTEMVFSSRLADRPPPLDGVTTSFADPMAVEGDAAHAALLGFGGKLLIHPAQVAPARLGFAPSPEELAWAEELLRSSPTGGAEAVAKTMVDAPVRRRAEQVIARAQALRAGPAV